MIACPYELRKNLLVQKRAAQATAQLMVDKNQRVTTLHVRLFKTHDLLFPMRPYLPNFPELPETVYATGIKTLIHQRSL